MTISQPVRSTCRLRTGIDLRYVDQGLPSAEQVVVAVHGWPDSWYSFSRLLPALTAAGHRAVAIDQRGFGESARPAAGYDVDNLATDLAAFLDAQDIPQATLIGHSMGSFVARRAAQLHPDRIRRLVLVGTGLTADTPVVREVAELVKDLPDPVPEDFTREFQSGTIHAPVPEPFFDGLVAESRKAPARVWRAVIERLLAFDDTAELADIAAPTLVIGGDRDAIFTPAEQQAAARPG
jgi:non-heme chloroperoxidase